MKKTSCITALLLVFLLSSFSSHAQTAESLPYFTNFEEGASGWTFLNDSNAWTHGTAVAYSGSHSLYISNDSVNHNYIYSGVSSVSFAYITIHITQSGEYLIRYKWMNNGENRYDYLRVFLAPDSVEFQAGAQQGISYSSLPTQFIALDGGLQLVLQSTWQNIENNIDVPDTGNYKLVLFWRNDANVGHLPPAAVDNLFFGPVTCHSPSNLQLTASSDTSFSLNWTAHDNDEPRQWLLTVGDSTQLVDTNVVTFGSLTPNTTYPVSLCHYCGIGDTSLFVFDTFRTSCSSPTIPYNEGFEGESLFCWTLHDANSASGNTGISSVNPHGGSQSLRLYPGTSSQPVFAVSPRINGLDTLMASFYLRGSNMVHVDIGVISNPLDTNTFLPISHIDALTPSGWTPYEIIFDQHGLEGDYLAFRFATSDFYGFNAYLDDIFIVPVPSCRRPLAADIDSLGAESIRLHITDTITGNSYQLSLLDTEGNTLVEITVTDTLPLLGGLTPATNYTLSVGTLCSDGDLSPAILIPFRTPSLAPIVHLDAPATALTGELLPFEVTLIDGSLDSLLFSWHSTLLDTTFLSTLPTLYLTYTVGGTDTFTVTATNAYGFASDTATLDITDCEIITDFPHTESFEEDNPCWTVLDADGDGYTFVRRDTLSVSGNSIMVSESFINIFPPHALHPDNWLLSPFFQLPPDSATLTWNDYSDPAYPAEHYTVYILSSYPSPLPLFDTTLAQGGWTTRAVDLSPYLGETVRFAFRHHACGGQTLLGIDDITLNHTSLFHPEPIDTVDTTTPQPLPRYTLTLLSNDSTMGTVYGGGLYDSASIVIVSAIASRGHRFSQWNDGNTDSVRTIILTSDSTLTAHFLPSSDSTGIVGIEKTGPNIIVFPNPASDMVTLKANDNTPMQAMLYDMSGRLLSTFKFQNSVFLEVNALAPGPYFLRINTCLNNIPVRTLRLVVE